MLHLPEQQIAAAPVLPHPMISPERTMVAPATARALPPRLNRPTLTTHGDVAIGNQQQQQRGRHSANPDGGNEAAGAASAHRAARLPGAGWPAVAGYNAAKPTAEPAAERDEDSGSGASAEPGARDTAASRPPLRRRRAGRCRRAASSSTTVPCRRRRGRASSSSGRQSRARTRGGRSVRSRWTTCARTGRWGSRRRARLRRILRLHLHRRRNTRAPAEQPSGAAAAGEPEALRGSNELLAL